MLFEALGYAVAFRVLVAERARLGDPVIDPVTRMTLLVIAVAGAVVGAKALSWLEDPATLWAHRTDPAVWLGGKTIVGALLGGLAATELAKPRLGIFVSTGDVYVRPLGIGLAIGRIGCFLSGVTDGTHGVATSVPWGLDLGDGVPRHPTALYEIGWLGVLGVAVEAVRWRRPGDRFAGWMVGYLGFRLGIEALKTQPFVYGGLSAIQVACLGGLAYYAARGWRLARRGPPEGPVG